MPDIEIKGFVIHSPGDPSVGMFSATWELTGGFIFDSQEDMAGFKQGLKEAFEWVSDDVKIHTFEELAAADIADREMERLTDDAMPSKEEITQNRELAADLNQQRTPKIVNYSQLSFESTGVYINGELYCEKEEDFYQDVDDGKIEIVQD